MVRDARDHLHTAFQTCSTYDEWIEVGADFDDDLLEGFTPEAFVDVGCEEPELVDSPVCATRG